MEPYLLIPILGIACGLLGIAGWIFTTWLRIKNGYPLDGTKGQPIYPGIDQESFERIKLLSTENAQLRAEMGSVKDRLETIERIVTDEPARLSREIDQLHLVPSKKDMA